MASRSARKRRLREEAVTQAMLRRLTGNGLAAEVEVVRLKGEEKVSDALLRMLAPYLEEFDSDLAFNSLVSLGVLAWNVGLLDTDSPGTPDLEWIVETALPSEYGVLRNLVRALVDRKRTDFAGYRRLIVEYEVSVTAGRRQLDLLTVEMPMPASAVKSAVAAASV